MPKEVLNYNDYSKTITILEFTLLLFLLKLFKYLELNRNENYSLVWASTRDTQASPQLSCKAEQIHLIKMYSKIKIRQNVN